MSGSAMVWRSLAVSSTAGDNGTTMAGRPGCCIVELRAAVLAAAKYYSDVLRERTWEPSGFELTVFSSTPRKRFRVCRHPRGGVGATGPLSANLETRPPSWPEEIHGAPGSRCSSPEVGGSCSSGRVNPDQMRIGTGQDAHLKSETPWSARSRSGRRSSSTGLRLVGRCRRWKPHHRP